MRLSPSFPWNLLELDTVLEISELGKFGKSISRVLFSADSMGIFRSVEDDCLKIKKSNLAIFNCSGRKTRGKQSLHK